jgi:hypothetical protein
MERLLTLWVDADWTLTTVKVLDGNGKVIDEYEGPDAGSAFLKLGDAIDIEAHS